MGEKLGGSKILQRTMSEKQKINILWYTQDLRIHDQESFEKILQEPHPFIALYIFDDNFYRQKQFGFRKIGKFRAKFLLETVTDLATNLEKLGITLVLKFGTTEEIFKEISEQYDIKTIFCQNEWTSEEIGMRRKISDKLPSARFHYSYTQFLTEPDFVREIFHDIPNVFTNWRLKLEKNWQIRGLNIPELETRNFLSIKLNSDEKNLKILGFEDFESDSRSAFAFVGGESNALERLEQYFFEEKRLSHYKETRNGLWGKDYSTKFSAWLANGSLSPVFVYYQIKKYEAQYGANDSTYWLVFELLWRDYFKYISLQFGNKIFMQEGIFNKLRKYAKIDTDVQLWISGKTSSDFVNANMVEIASTGFMSNRGRQNVASYFAKTMHQNWLLGAAYFEEQLVDYDVHSNYCNWMYVAGVGNDPRNRQFNPEKQAEMYDPQGKYRKIWLNTI